MPFVFAINGSEHAFRASSATAGLLAVPVLMSAKSCGPLSSSSTSKIATSQTHTTRDCRRPRMSSLSRPLTWTPGLQMSPQQTLVRTNSQKASTHLVPPCSVSSKLVMKCRLIESRATLAGSSITRNALAKTARTNTSAL